MPPVSPPAIKTFGPFTVDPVARTLMHGHDTVTLTPKQFDVLEYMVENPGRLLSKQELLQALWPDSFVEESNLSQNVYWLRKALRSADSAESESDRYILTVQGRGYRFIAPVAEQVSEPVPRTEPTLADVPVGLPAQQAPITPPRPVRKQRWLITAALLTVLIATGGYVAWKHYNRDIFQLYPYKPEVLIVQIQNSTSDPELTRALNGILRRGISQSPIVAIVPRVEIDKTLRYMQLPAGTPVTSANAQAICLRRNSSAFVETSIVPEGSGFLLTVEAVNCVTGKVQSVGRAVAATKDQVLVALDGLLPQLRRDLGESASSVRQFSIPVENATTASFEAFKAFLAAEDLRAKGETVKAVPLFQRALQLDPNFALAHLALGTCYQTMNERAASIAEFTRAYDLRGRVSAREHLYIEFFYVKIVQGDQAASVQLNEEWARLWPMDSSPYVNGTDSLNQLDRFQDAIVNGEKGLRLFPDNGLIYVALGQAYLRAGRLDDLKRIGERAVALHVDGWQLHEMLWQRALILEDAATATAERAWAARTPDDYLALADETLVELQRGRVAEAIASQRRFVTAAAAQSARDAADTAAGKLALMLEEMGMHTQARSYVLAWKAANPTPEIAMALAAVGEQRSAESLLQQVQQGREQDTLVNQWQLPIIRALLALHEGTEAGAQRAVDALQAAKPLDLHDFMATYLRGKAFLAMHKPREAQAEFQHIVDNQGADAFSPLYPLSLLQLARAKTLAGDTAGSRAAYDRLLHRWQQADAGLPLLAAAKSERARLP